MVRNPDFAYLFAASVSIERQAPFRPRLKLTRPAVMAAELPVAPNVPTLEQGIVDYKKYEKDNTKYNNS